MVKKINENPNLIIINKKDFRIISIKENNDNKDSDMVISKENNSKLINNEIKIDKNIKTMSNKKNSKNSNKKKSENFENLNLNLSLNRFTISTKSEENKNVIYSSNNPSSNKPNILNKQTTTQSIRKSQRINKKLEIKLKEQNQIKRKKKH